ncbi:MAG TPA: M1 family aminopeptidase [Gemmatimonadaceae bacterium]|nr:M1 family aminopeptidase [Gemmatimonadaceae bacterium]
MSGPHGAPRPVRAALASAALYGLVGIGACSAAGTGNTPGAHAAPAYHLPQPAHVVEGAPTPDSLAGLVVARFATGTQAGFDSVYPDPLGRAEVEYALRRNATRGPGPHRVLWKDGRHAVLLITGTMRPGRGAGLETGGNVTNLVRRFSGLYEAADSGGVWRLTRQIPFDTANFIRAQTLHVALAPGTGSTIVDTLAIDIGSPFGLAMRLNNAAQLATVQLDGNPAEHLFGGGVLWVKAPPRKNLRLVLRYAIANEHRATASGSATAAHAANTAQADTARAYGALNNTDVWHPFFGYDSGHDLAQLSVTATIPATYQLTTTVPQTERVANGVRTVHGESMHPEFLLALIYDRDWRPVTTQIGALRFQTFLTPSFHFSHDTLAALAARVYHVLVPRFGIPLLPSHYLAVVEDRALGNGGFTVRMNNAVISAGNATSLDETALGPSFVFAHETSHGWTMNATGLAANFLTEGWASYSESLLLGDVYGPAMERAFWERMRTSYVTGRDRNGYFGGFEGKQSILGNPDNGRIHYYKGSWILHSLNEMLGDSVFDRGMRAYIAHSGHGPDGYQEFIADMSHAAGRDLAPFIMPWLSETYIPDVTARVAGHALIVMQTQPTVPFDLPLDVELATPSGAVRRQVHLTTRADTVNLGALGPVTQVRVDPDHHFLLRRHWGDTVRFTLRTPAAKTVALFGNFLIKPVPATRHGDVWTVEMPLTEGRYLWLWVVDGKRPSDEEALAAVKAGHGDETAIAGMRTVKPILRLPDADAR